MMKRNTRLIAAAAASMLSLTAMALPAYAQVEIFNPDWSITLTDFGYSDLLYDQRAGFEGREYLSGEWGAAVDYSIAGDARPAPTWLEPYFIYPDWTTNSDFAVTSYITGTASEAFGGGYSTAAMSVISNGDLEITQTYTMIDTGSSTPGIAQGLSPASFGGPGASSLSTRYVMKQEYSIKNVSGQNITDLELFQFLHGLNSEVAIYDDRAYTGNPFDTYQYDTTLRGASVSFGGGGDFGEFALVEGDFGEYLFDDVITFHSEVEPVAFGSGYYGINDGTDDHISTGKPSIGVHLDVEADSLNGVDSFDPSAPELWVSGAQKYSLASLLPGETVSFDVLLSVQTSQELVSTVPEPSSLALLLCGLAGLATCYRRRRTL